MPNVYWYGDRNRVDPERSRALSRGDVGKINNMRETGEVPPVRLAVLASGRGSNLQALINAQQQDQLPVEFVGVGSDQPEAQALDHARSAGIPVRAFPVCSGKAEQEGCIAEWLKETEAQLLALAGYMRLLSGEFVRNIGIPILNIHPSLLPSFPGLHAQRQTLDARVKYGGCTVHYVDEGMDTGPVVLQCTVPVLEGDDEESLSQRILQAEHQLYPKAIRLVCRNIGASACGAGTADNSTMKKERNKE